MATPTKNSVATTHYSTSIFDSETDSLLYGTKWGGGLGKGVTLTYSFPEGTTWWQSGYGGDEPDSYHGFTDAHRQAARDALATWAHVANIKFVEVDDGHDKVGELRFAFTDNISETAAAHTYMPNSRASAGDVWFSMTQHDRSSAPGTYFYKAMVHEIGHGLGLNHSFDLKPAYDNFFYSIMSYTASPWSDDNYASFYPTTPMYFDILALQAIYGTDGLRSNPGNTKYKFTGGPYFQTIFDTGGEDTIVYSGADTCQIKLKIGAYCVVSEAIQFSGTSARSTVIIGPRTVIENATGGEFNDYLDGNTSKNTLRGRGGADTILGAAGDDTLVGGGGGDRLKGQGGRDVFDFNATSESGTAGHDRIADFKLGQDRIDLSTIDANLLTSGNGKFSFAAKADSSLNGKAGELIWYKSAGSTFVVGDTDGDAIADFMLELSGGKSLTSADFIL